MTEDEMVRWHHQCDGHEFGLGVGNGEGGLACCNPWGRKELDTTERLLQISFDTRDFFGGPVAKTPRSQCRGPGFNPWPGN